MCPGARICGALFWRSQFRNLVNSAQLNLNPNISASDVIQPPISNFTYDPEIALIKPQKSISKSRISQNVQGCSA